MSLHRVCCCDAPNFCQSAVEAWRCQSGERVTGVYTGPGQVFSFSGSFSTSYTRTDITPTGTDVVVNTRSGTIAGRLGLALSRQPFTRSQVIQRYGLNQFDFVTAFDSTFVNGLHRAIFDARTQVEDNQGGPPGSASASIGGVGQPFPGALGIGIGLNAFVGVSTVNSTECGSATRTFSNLFGETTETSTSNYSSSYTGASHGASYNSVNISSPLVPGFTQIIDETGSASISLSMIERLPTMLDGSDGGFDCTNPSTTIFAPPIDPSVAEHMMRDPVHQCRSCGG